VIPFEVREPKGGESPVLVEVPHAGLALDAEALAFTVAKAKSIAHDADLYVDELFQDVPHEGATLLWARTSRYLVDLNRGERDFDAESAEGGGSTPLPRGLIWRLTTEGEAIVSAPLPRAEVERRLALDYRPYHACLAAILQRKRERFGFAVMLCAHSMPSLPRGGIEPAPHRADLVPGSRGRTTASGAVIDRVDAHGRAHGWSVRHDDPYRGGFSTGHYGRPARGVHVVQIEIARRLYMDEPTLRRDRKGFQAVSEFGRTLAARLAFSDAESRRALLPDGPPVSAKG
jgi:N-formylglutamate deformylase